MTSKERLSEFVSKLGTVLVDRRFWAAAAVVVLSVLGVFGVDEATIQRVRDLAGEDGAAVVAVMEKLVPALISLLVTMKLIDSWAERPPSGIAYKEVLETKKKSSETRLREILDDLGIEID